MKSKRYTEEQIIGVLKEAEAGLNEHWFLTMAHARRTIESWRIEYNTVRPYSSLGNLTPEQYAMACVGRLNEAESKTADLSPGPY